MTSRSSRIFSIDHLTTFEYERPFVQAVMLLRLRPKDYLGQDVRNFNYQITPESKLVEFEDRFGNICHLASFPSSDNTEISIRSCSEVEISIDASANADASEVDWDAVERVFDLVYGWETYAFSTRVYMCPSLERFVAKHGIERTDSPLESLSNAAHILFESLRYEPGSTKVDSTIEDCLEIGSGVCQDFTHILLALGRNWGIAGRYVSGYLHLNADTENIVTENASHAWAEFLLPLAGWVGIDATNNTLVDDRYIRVATGRDYDDVAPTKGIIQGGGHSTLSVNVSLEHQSTSADQ